jgi:hypothetical protein
LIVSICTSNRRREFASGLIEFCSEALSRCLQQLRGPAQTVSQTKITAESAVIWNDLKLFGERDV